MLKKIKNYFKYHSLVYKLNWIDILWSPFKNPKPIFYFGKIKVGTPYFYPRHWRKSKTKKGYREAVPAKWFKLDIVGLGWKDKYDSPRSEWSPMFSIVFCYLQFVVIFKHDDPIWETYLTYKHYIDKNIKATYHRLHETRKVNPNIWTRRKDGMEIKTDWFLKSLKSRWFEKFNKNS